MVPSINLCGQNRNHPAPARRGLPCAERVNLDGSARTASSAYSARATRMSRALLATSSPSCHPCQGQGHSCMELTLALAWQTRRRGCGSGVDKERTSIWLWQGTGEDVDLGLAWLWQGTGEDVDLALAWMRRGRRFGLGEEQERTSIWAWRGSGKDEERMSIWLWRG